jgi:hypothetical protein
MIDRMKSVGDVLYWHQETFLHVRPCAQSFPNDHKLCYIHIYPTKKINSLTDINNIPFKHTVGDRTGLKCVQSQTELGGL